MRKVITYFLLIFIFFSSYIELSVISGKANTVCGSVIEETTNLGIKTDIIKIQYDLMQKMKGVVLNISDIIVRDVKEIGRIPVRQKREKMVSKVANIVREEIGRCVLTAFFLAMEKESIKLSKDKTRLPLFFFGYIYLYILKYLGLLFIFWKRNNKAYIKKEAYSI